jgi:hypothetical protein
MREGPQGSRESDRPKSPQLHACLELLHRLPLKALAAIGAAASERRVPGPERISSEISEKQHGPTEIGSPARYFSGVATRSRRAQTPGPEEPAKRARPRGSRNPERIKSQNLQGCLGNVNELALVEQAVVRAHVTENIARANAFPDRPGSRRDWCILALSEADLRKREATGKGLEKTRDYTDYAPEWGPALSTIYAEFPNFPRARSAAGLYDTLQPETRLAVVTGRSVGRKRKWTDDDFVHSLALCYERNWGRYFSEPTYERFTGSEPRELPGSAPFAFAKSGRHWGDWLELAADYILKSGPQRLPRSYDYISRSRALKGDEAA